MSSNWANLAEAVSERDRQIASLNQVMAERDGRIADLNQAIAARDGQIASLNWQITSLNKTAVGRDNAIKRILSSRSWRLTKPLRLLGRMIRGDAAILRRDGLVGLERRDEILLQRSSRVLMHQEDYGGSQDLYGEGRPVDQGFTPKVSIIVPNFNHERYLRERLDSIYHQSYKNIEVILLDDCSEDRSLYLLKEYADRFPEKTVCCFNEINSGGVFHQWKKGLELATGELVWIAESDDYCTANFLDELVRYFANQAVMLAYGRSDFVRGSPPLRVWTTEAYLADLNLDCWGRPFIKSAHWLVNNAWAVKNIVPNVSSAVFRHPGKMDLLNNPEWINLRLCGDWIFYLTIIRGGLVAYSPHATNYYRQHAHNTSVNTQKEDIYYQEHEIVAKNINSLYRLNPSVLEKQRNHLYQHWRASRGISSEAEFRSLYDIDRIKRNTEDRKINVVMAAHALVAGGGETFPITLANMLKAHGYSVTFFNCGQKKTEPGIRRMLGRNVPLLELDRLELAGAAFDDIGVELVHSHHAWVDVTLSSLLKNNPEIKQIVTMHGMYETMTQDQFQSILPILERRIEGFVYLTEKNLLPFSKAFRNAKNFVRIDNALEISEINPVPRSELGIQPDDFVLCLVSRAVPEKGWEEGIKSVVWARAHCKRSIHLLLVGGGPEFDRLNIQVTDGFIHFLGFRPNVKDYYAASDLGFLPSRFPGESCPLVLIECLNAGRPMLASNIGEIKQMLQTEDAKLAGEVFDLDDFTVPIQTVGNLIVELAENGERYRRLLSRVPNAASKFNPLTTLRNYESVYRSCFANGAHQVQTPVQTV